VARNNSPKTEITAKGQDWGYSQRTRLGLQPKDKDWGYSQRTRLK